MWTSIQVVKSLVSVASGLYRYTRGLQCTSRVAAALAAHSITWTAASSFCHQLSTDGKWRGKGVKNDLPPSSKPQRIASSNRISGRDSRRDRTCGPGGSTSRRSVNGVAVTVFARPCLSPSSVSFFVLIVVWVSVRRLVLPLDIS